MNTCIVIPARYESTRFPGKPLAMIDGQSLLSRVCDVAKQIPNARVLVATDDQRIVEHAIQNDVEAVMTPNSCATGTDRVLAAIKQLKEQPDFIINLQGDTPLTPSFVLQELIAKLQKHEIATPAVQLTWEMLDTLRAAKQITPFSGTTVVINNKNEAIWFSKNIIPAIRNEDKLRETSKLSPIFQHLGIYGYSRKMLEEFTKLPHGHYEQLEGLEQLRLLENGYKINIAKVNLQSQNAWRGVDTPEDLKFVEAIIQGKT